MPIESAAVDRPVPLRWSLRVLGRLRLTDAAGTEIALPGRLDSALLAYLVLNQGRRQPRTKLAGLLWPDRANPRHCLSVSLNELRNTLGDDEGRVIAHKSDPVETDFRALAVDALSFERLAAEGTRESLEQAEAVCAGELLEGLDTRSQEFDSWLAAERDRIRDVQIGVLSRLQYLRAEAGEIDKAIDTALRLLQLDELHEDSYRLLMRLHLRAGRRSAALKAAQSCGDILQREKIDPEPETRRLMEEIRRSDPLAPRPVSLEAAITNASVAAIGGEETSDPGAVPAAAPTRSDVKARRGARRLPLIFAVIAMLGLLPLAYYHWRYWDIPWLAPNPIDNTIIALKRLLPGDPPPRIAVLPFASPGGDDDAETLANGLSGDISEALGKISEMFVIAVASVVPYGPRPADLRQVARDLDVKYLLLGSVRQSGDQLRVQVQLIDATAGHQVWGNSYPGQAGDVFALQDQITFDVITEVQVELTEGDMERLRAIHGTRNLDAWLTAGEGLKLLRHVTPEDNARARRLYEKSMAYDDRYAGAWEGLAWTHLLDAEFGWSPSTAQSLAEAQRLTQRALELAPDRPRLYSLRGHINLLLGDFDQAVADGERAVEAERNDADAAALLGFTLTYTDEPNRAIALMRRAIELSPRYPAWYGWVLGRAYRLAGESGRAVDTLEASVPERPASVIPLVELVIAYSEVGDIGMAKAIAATIRERVPQFSIGAWAARQPYMDPAMTDRDAAALRASGLPD
jgi:adenylate cyclase